MKNLGTEVMPATHGAQALKESVDGVFSVYLLTLRTVYMSLGVL